MSSQTLPSKPFVTLSEAVSWIAFGDCSNSEIHWREYSQAKLMLENALTRFVDAASAGAIRTLGKLVAGHDIDPMSVDTVEIPAERFQDFRQYDQTYCGLRVGAGLFGFATEGNASFDYAVTSIGRREFYREVVVCRDDLIAQFPETMKGRRATPEEIEQWCRDWIKNGKGRDGNKAWKVFKDAPEFTGLSRDDCFRPAWEAAKTK